MYQKITYVIIIEVLFNHNYIIKFIFIDTKTLEKLLYQILILGSVTLTTLYTIIYIVMIKDNLDIITRRFNNIFHNNIETKYHIYVYKYYYFATFL